jgi:signal transduction histidine kinase
MKFALHQRLERLWKALEVPEPDPAQLRRRFKIVERDLVLPTKAAGLLVVFFSFVYSPVFGDVSTALDVAVEKLQMIFWIYLAINMAGAVVLLRMERLPLAIVQWTVFTLSLLDGVFICGLVLVSGGYDSILFWLFVGLIVRNAASLSPTLSQATLNLCIILCYVLAGVLDVAVSKHLAQYVAEGTQRTLDLGLPENPTEPFILRLVILVLTAFCCFGLEVLLERHRLALEEAREFSLREGQIRSAGRLAAEIAHQIKNPLAIINNAAFSLQKAAQEGKRDLEKQIQVIQEEVGRSDRIVTELMGYAQLSEGHVEKLDVAEELDRAIAQVFPPAAHYPITIQRAYQGHLLPLLMQRRHLAEVLVNLLQNAREAMDGGGNLLVRAGLRGENTITIEVRDSGAGIPPDKLERVFEPYYTTKPKGTGLGLAIVRHNIELYGGTVRAESELGKGAQFTVAFPARISIRSAATT